MSAASRQRRRRRRAREGKVVLPVEVLLHAVAGAMIRAEMLSETDALDQAKVAKVAAEVLAEWSWRWPYPVPQREPVSERTIGKAQGSTGSVLEPVGERKTPP